MNRDLTATEIDEVLNRQLYGHLGCTMADTRVYVVPITYAYHDDAIYSFSFPGLKIETLRLRPSACFQTEQFLSEGIWHSVIVWGTYEEIPDEQRMEAIKVMSDRLEREHGTATSAFYRTPDNKMMHGVLRVPEEESPVLFRIRIEQKTGKHVQNN